MKIILRSIQILLLLNLFACSPEKRLANLIKKHPELIHHDTIFKTDTIKISGVVHDTLIQSGITHDTITIHDKQLTVKYFNNGKTVYIKGICDTVFKTIKVPVEVNSVNPVEIKTVYKEHWYLKPLIWWFVITFMLVCLWVYSKFK